MSAGRDVPADLRAKIRQRVDAGESIKDVAADVGLHATTVSKIVKINGVARRKVAKSDNIAAAVRMAGDGLDRNDIAGRLGVSRTALWHMLRRQAIDIPLDRGRRGRKALPTILELARAGKSLRVIASTVGLARDTVRELLRQEGVSLRAIAASRASASIRAKVVSAETKAARFAARQAAAEAKRHAKERARVAEVERRAEAVRMAAVREQAEMSRQAEMEALFATARPGLRTAAATRSRRSCERPLWSDRVDHRYCGKPTAAGQSYCEDCRAILHVRIREHQPDRVSAGGVP